MVHRDPETGRFLSHDDDEPVELTYADHEFANFRVGYQNQSGGPDGSPRTEFFLENDVLDLENDELGMLAWLSASLCVGFADFAEDNATKGGAHVGAEIGANLAGSEYLYDKDSPDYGVQVTSNTGSVNFSDLKASDEPGLWAILNAGASSPFDQATSDSDTGNGEYNIDRMRRVYYEETGGGPYIDSTDDISIGITEDRSETQAEIDVELTGQMAFVVFEYENRRAEFAPYDPGPMMG